jgi:N-acetyl-alpha-D-muramate 1-phosphate uridylyltransferase
MDVLLLVAASATSVGVDWAGDFLMDAEGRLMRRRESEIAPFVYAGVGIIKPQLFADAKEDAFRLAPYFFAAAESGRLFGHRLDGQWLHVGTPAAVEEAERAIARSAR